MAVGIGGGDQGERIGKGQGLVNIFISIFLSVVKGKGKGAVACQFKTAVLRGLIPESKNAGSSVGLAKQGVLVVNAGINQPIITPSPLDPKEGWRKVDRIPEDSILGVSIRPNRVGRDS